MTFRKAEADDARALAELWTRTFPSERTVADRLRQLEAGRPYGGWEASWLEEERGSPVGAFRAYRLTEYIHGEPLPMLGLAGVAVASTARRRGLARRLCAEALRIGHERGDAISVLYPFRPAFYHAMGWGLVGALHSHLFRPESLPHYPESAAIRHAEPSDHEAITGCYEQASAASNGLLRRDEGMWTLHLDAPGVHALVYDDGGVRGYATVRYARGRVPDARVLTVRELVALDDVAYRGLLGWISAQRDQWRLVRYDSRPEECFDLRLADPRPPLFRHARTLWFPTARVIRAPMLRVLNVPAALEACWTGGSRASGSLELRVRDAEMPENEGPWHVVVEGSAARVEPMKARGRPGARIATDASTFAQLFTGELSPSAAARFGLAETSGSAAALDGLFRARSSYWLLDEF